MSSTNENAVPLANENAVQLGNKEIVPLANQNAVPLANQNGVPLGDENAVPLANQNAVPPAAYSAKENSLALSMREKLNALPNRPSTTGAPTILRVPADLRKNREHLIVPSVVSIGPYHHNRVQLKPMEDKKWLLLQDVLSQHHNKVSLKKCVKEIEGVQLLARSCYSESVNMDNDSFVEMLILDGTFIIQLILKSLPSLMKEMGRVINSISTDLILMENQIPFFVVEILWWLYVGKQLSFKNLQSIMMVLGLPYKGNIIKSICKSETSVPGFHNLLHLWHYFLVPDMSAPISISMLPGCFCFNLCTGKNFQHDDVIVDGRGRDQMDEADEQGRDQMDEEDGRGRDQMDEADGRGRDQYDDVIFPCAIQLDEAGIKFRKKKHPRTIVDVTFHAGKLEIPFIPVGNSSMRLFHNLLVFEQCRQMSFPRYFTSYAIFMDFIINTKRDVGILQRNGIIGEMISSEAKVAGFFNQLCEGAYISESDNYLKGVIREMNRYYHSKYHRNCSQLIRNYFNSPWSIISLFAACILLGLTFAQTYFSGYDYFHPSPK